MKQLIEIYAAYLQVGDLVFDPKGRSLAKVYDIYFENSNGSITDNLSSVSNVYFSFDKEEKYLCFKARTKVYILVNTEAMRVIDNTQIYDEIVELGKGVNL